MTIAALLLSLNAFFGSGRFSRRFLFYLFWVPGNLAIVAAIFLYLSGPLFDQDLMIFPYYKISVFAGLICLLFGQMVAQFGGKSLIIAQLSEERQQRAISDITQVAVSSTSIMELLNFSLDRIIDMLGMAGGAIHVFHRARQNLVLGSYKGLSARLARRLETIDLGDTAIGKSAKNKRLLIIRNLRLSPDYEIFGGKIEGFSYMALIPIISEGEHWGVITLLGKGGYTPGQLQVDLLEQFGEQLGAALVLGRQMRATQSSLDNMKSLIGSLGDELFAGSKVSKGGEGIIRGVAWSLTRILNGDRFDLCRQDDTGWVITLSSEPGTDRRPLTIDPGSEFDQSRPSGMVGWDQSPPFTEFMERRPYIFCLLPDKETWMFIRLESRRRASVNFDFFYDSCRIIYGLSKMIKVEKKDIPSERTLKPGIPATMKMPELMNLSGAISETFGKISHDLEKLIDEYSSNGSEGELKGLLGWLEVIRKSALEGKNVAESVTPMTSEETAKTEENDLDTSIQDAIEKTIASSETLSSIRIEGVDKSITLKYPADEFTAIIEKFLTMAVGSAGENVSLSLTSDSNGNSITLNLEGEKLPAPRGARPRWISEAGAKLECSSREDKGKAVEKWRLILPETPIEHKRDRMTRVLAVDTRDIIRDLLAGMLTQLGYEPVVVENSSEALRLFEKAIKSDDRFDIVIADNEIDELSGLRMAARMKSADPDIFFILTSSWGMEPEQALVKKSGVDMVMEKPFRLEQLAEAIEDAGKKAAAR